MKKKLWCLLLIAAAVLLMLWNVGAHYGGFLHGLGTALVPDEIHANNTASKLVAALQHRDAAAVKALFSPNAATQAGDLDGQIMELLAFVRGDVVACDDAGNYAVGSSSHSEYGNRQSEILATVRLETTTDAYYISFRQTLTDSFDWNNVGVTVLCIVHAEDYDSSSVYRADRSLPPGIYLEETTAP